MTEPEPPKTSTNTLLFCDYVTTVEFLSTAVTSENKLKYLTRVDLEPI